jgi:hypothetical protein
MGFNKRILPDKITLQNMVYDFGVKDVVDRYEKTDMVIGNPDAVEYFNSLIEQYELGR